ncbi:dTMP kinase [Desulfocicer vacuolatum]|nr:dTMP kinase [Desulfocicer vacuolatum]
MFFYVAEPSSGSSMTREEVSMFITLEGIEGSGKTTQITAIKKYLEAAGHGVVVTREPGATAIGQRIRSIVLDPENHDISPLCELLLYGADRAQHLAQVVVPALDAGKIVLCDRFADATRVYQGVARGLDMALIDAIHGMVVGPLTPDLTILFDLEPETGLSRTFKALENGQRESQESRFEKEALAFHAAVRSGYLALAQKEKQRFFVVDASLQPDEVFIQIKQGLATCLGIHI